MSIMIIISIVISIIVIIGSYILNKRALDFANTQEKLSQYECGFEPIEEKPGIETRERKYIKYYIIGIIFLIFDLEAIILYPFITILYSNMSTGINILTPYIVFLIFMSILILGLFYEYKKGVLD